MNIPGLKRGALGHGQRWYVVHTRPYSEDGAQQQLGAQGFSTFLPRLVRTVRRGRKLNTIAGPLFPRYLFIALDLERDRWRCVNGTIGVSSLVMGKELPTAVPRGVVEGLSAVCTDHRAICLGRELHPGDRVRVLDGPFAELFGELTRIDATGRVRVLMQMLGGDIPVSMPLNAIVSAPQV
jgi:transcription elongation factor/antiterminator RfaH